jgi:uncharacterized alkaline shock family protein YloU
MTNDSLVLNTDEGTITVSASALTHVVVRAAEGVDGARVRRPRRGVDVTLTDTQIRVAVELTARYGVPLPELAREVQERVAAALGELFGLDVESVDVAIEELESG